jgi:hypothetical protein
MDFDLNKAQKLLQQSARDFFARECKPERVRDLMATERPMTTACGARWPIKAGPA